MRTGVPASCPTGEKKYLPTTVTLMGSALQPEHGGIQSATRGSPRRHPSGTSQPSFFHLFLVPSPHTDTATPFRPIPVGRSREVRGPPPRTAGGLFTPTTLSSPRPAGRIHLYVEGQPRQLGIPRMMPQFISNS